jgi:hypothetical protein
VARGSRRIHAVPLDLDAPLVAFWSCSAPKHRGKPLSKNTGNGEFRERLKEP